VYNFIHPAKINRFCKKHQALDFTNILKHPFQAIYNEIFFPPIAGLLTGHKKTAPQKGPEFEPTLAGNIT